MSRIIILYVMNKSILNCQCSECRLLEQVVDGAKYLLLWHDNIRLYNYIIYRQPIPILCVENK